MKFIKSSFLFLTILIFAGCMKPNSPVTIFINATIWTGNENAPFAEAIAVEGDTIVFVGTSSEVLSRQGKETKVIDLEGKFVVPGFTDNHVHFLSGGNQLVSLDLRVARSPAEFAEIVKKFAADRDSAEWIVGGDWDHEAWGGNLPRKQWIDSLTADIPVFVNRLDGHMGLANSKALALANITKNTPNPEGGTIVKDANTGEPTGVLKDEAMSLIYEIMPGPSETEFDAMLKRATAHALSLGLTQVHDVGSFGGWRDLETYRRAARQGHLNIRIYSFVPISAWQEMVQYVTENGKGNDLLRWGGLKGFVDGSLGSTTAWFYEPYDDAPETSGLLIADTTELKNNILAADAAGLQLAVHAIGDHANDWLLGVFELAQQQNGDRDRRFRIEHAQHLTEEALSRFAGQSVLPSMQPYHCIDDGRWAEKRIGQQRLLTTYAFRSLLDAGASLTFGSDWTVAPLNPLEGIYAAVTRRTLDGKNPEGWVPQEKISVEEALRAYTISNAYAGFMEAKTGTLEIGKLADFTVLSDNLFEIPPEAIRDVKVLKTVLGGKVVY